MRPIAINYKYPEDKEKLKELDALAYEVKDKLKHRDVMDVLIITKNSDNEFHCGDTDLCCGCEQLLYMFGAAIHYHYDKNNTADS